MKAQVTPVVFSPDNEDENWKMNWRCTSIVVFPIKNGDIPIVILHLSFSGEYI